MRNKYFFFTILALTAAFQACTVEKVSPDKVDIGYTYYPLDEGRYWEYEIEKTTYSLDNIKEIDTFYVREVITDVSFAFDDELKQMARYIKTEQSDEWELDSLWTTKRTASQALRTEQNITHVKMVFPTDLDKTWNGNAYNSKDEEVYTYANLEQPFSVKGETFNNTVHVLIGPNLPPNLIETDERYEVYAKGVGNVFRFSKVLGHQPPEYDTVGVKKVTKLMDYGQ